MANTYENAVTPCVGGGAPFPPPLSVLVATLVPSGAAIVDAAPPEACTTSVPTTPVKLSGVAATSTTRALPVRPPPTYVAEMGLDGDEGHVTLTTRLVNPLWPTFTPDTAPPSYRTIVRSRSGMTMRKGVLALPGSVTAAPPLASETDTVTTRESRGRLGCMSVANVARGAAARNAEPVALVAVCPPDNATAAHKSVRSERVRTREAAAAAAKRERRRVDTVPAEPEAAADAAAAVADALAAASAASLTGNSGLYLAFSKPAISEKGEMPYCTMRTVTPPPSEPPREDNAERAALDKVMEGAGCSATRAGGRVTLPAELGGKHELRAGERRTVADAPAAGASVATVTVTPEPQYGTSGAVPCDIAPEGAVVSDACGAAPPLPAVWIDKLKAFASEFTESVTLEASVAGRPPVGTGAGGSALLGVTYPAGGVAGAAAVLVPTTLPRVARSVVPNEALGAAAPAPTNASNAFTPDTAMVATSVLTDAGCCVRLASAVAAAELDIALRGAPLKVKFASAVRTSVASALLAALTDARRAAGRGLPGVAAAAAASMEDATSAAAAVVLCKTAPGGELPDAEMAETLSANASASPRDAEGARGGKSVAVAQAMPKAPRPSTTPATRSTCTGAVGTVEPANSVDDATNGAGGENALLRTAASHRGGGSGLAMSEASRDSSAS